MFGGLWNIPEGEGKGGENVGVLLLMTGSCWLRGLPPSVCLLNGGEGARGGSYPHMTAGKISSSAQSVLLTFCRRLLCYI